MPKFTIKAPVIDVQTNVKFLLLKRENCRKKVINKDDNIYKSEANKHGMTAFILCTEVDMVL